MAGRHPVAGGGALGSFAGELHYLSSPFGDTTYTKVFVGGLAWETQSDGLRCHFEPYGEILEAVVITDKNTGRSKGYGFVTFRDPESAKRACVDPSPTIDGRQANCNLASLGRPQLSPVPYVARVRPAVPLIGSLPVPRGGYIGSSAYNQHIPYTYQHSFTYPPYGYTAYGHDYMYTQNLNSLYGGQQYVQIYRVPGTNGAPVYPFAQMAHSISSAHNYPTIQGYAVPSQTLVQLGGTNTGSVPANQASAYPSGMISPTGSQPQFYLPVRSQQFQQGSVSDQTAG